MYDLNDPEDARIYCAVWINKGRLVLNGSADVMELSDQEILDLAHEFFIHADHPISEGYFQ